MQSINSQYKYLSRASLDRLKLCDFLLSLFKIYIKKTLMRAHMRAIKMFKTKKQIHE